ncbi:sensor histidine kinase [Lacibacter sp.]|uniref:sensor histidine kinase n=1 Tax=Lacibacter sp. TaxID=1915409 RepID=UPI002B4AF5CA|nr:histidine kinase [Lacibacter sp.]HLP38635.1 histidine kinase [Lacibacter sp.]
MNSFLYNEFIFSSRYRIWRHLLYWTFHVAVWAAFWMVMGVPLSYGRQLLNMVMWVPAFIIFGYPLVYGAIPHLLLKGRVWQFFLFVLLWGVVGLYIDAGYRSYVLIPAQEAMGLDNILPRGPLAFCYLCMTTSAASPMIIKFFKLWTIKQREWIQAQQEKTTAELQLLKAQVHPHFLFNTLNNIYSFSLDNSPKTPGLILKLSSLLSYMLYDCKTDEVRLEKEIDIMKNYIDLERERYGNKIEISWCVEGEIKDKLIAPLLLLPFLENAFKHGVSEQIEKPWLGVDISVQHGTLRCKIANSKNEYVPESDKGIGIDNVKQRLAFIYPGKHELKINDEGSFFVVSLMLVLADELPAASFTSASMFIPQTTQHETSLPAYR